MSIQVGWHVQGKVLYLKGRDSITFADMKSITAESKTYLDESDAPLVHILADLTNTDNQIRSLKERVEVIRPLLEHPQCGWIIMVGQTNPVANFISSTAAQVFKARFRTFATVEEGITFLRQVATSVDHIPDLVSEGETQ